MFSKHISKTDNVKQNIISFLKKISASKRQTLDSLLYYANLYEIVTPAQTTIANKIGTRRETVNRIIDFLVEHGLINKTTRLWNTCIYEINPILNDLDLRWELRNLFKSFKMRPLIPLLIIPFVTTIDSKENKSFHNHKSHHISLSFPSIYKKDLKSSFINTTTTILKETKKDSDMLEAQLEVSERIRNLDLKLTIVQQQQLAKFPDDVISRAEILLKRKKSVKDPVAYFFWLCKNELHNPTKLEEVVASNGFPKKTIEAKSAVMPKAWANTDKTGLNADMPAWQIAQQIRDAINMPAGPFVSEGFRNRVLLAYCEKDYKHLDDCSKQLEALQFIDIHRIKLGLTPRLTPEIKPQSTIVNENTIEQPKTHQNDNRVNLDIVVDYPSGSRSPLEFKNYYEERYADKPEVLDWLQTLNYNPDDEVEDLDLPLRL